eukprot:GEMP01072568.1.p1 GENE.GEMP01072568.1~~GEMP01072568.1.p1  ORF type:complete len:138 (+),score=23.33 GEMP01072568.1:59-415(+)
MSSRARDTHQHALAGMPWCSPRSPTRSAPRPINDGPSRSPPNALEITSSGRQVVRIPVKHTGYRPENHAKQYTAQEDKAVMDLPPTKTMLHHFPEFHEVGHCYVHKHMPPKDGQPRCP